MHRLFFISLRFGKKSFKRFSKWVDFIEKMMYDTQSEFEISAKEPKICLKGEIGMFVKGDDTHFTA